MQREQPPTLPPTERLVLDLLLSHGPMYGLQLVGAAEGRLKRGTVYVTLARMEQKGLVSSEQEDPEVGEGGLPRRVYRSTPFGARVAKAWSTLYRDLAAEAAR